MLFDAFNCYNTVLPDSFIVDIKSNFLFVTTILGLNLKFFDIFLVWPTLLATTKLFCISHELVWTSNGIFFPDSDWITLLAIAGLVCII